MTQKSLFLFIAALFMFSFSGLAQKFTNPIVGEDVVFEEEDGIVAVEAEFFYKQSKSEILFNSIFSKAMGNEIIQKVT